MAQPLPSTPCCRARLQQRRAPWPAASLPARVPSPSDALRRDCSALPPAAQSGAPPAPPAAADGPAPLLPSGAPAGLRHWRPLPLNRAAAAGCRQGQRGPPACETLQAAPNEAHLLQNIETMTHAGWCPPIDESQLAHDWAPVFLPTGSLLNPWRLGADHIAVFAIILL